MKTTFISEVVPGAEVDDLFAVRNVELKEYSGGKMITVELVDRSGRINGVIWNGTSDDMDMLQPGKIYRVQGTVTTYKSKSQLTINAIKPTEKYDPDDFLARGEFSREELDNRLNQAIAKVDDSYFRKLLDSVFSEKGYRDGFLRGVGGKLWHHNYIGGLAEHTLCVFDICLDISSRYREIDRDLLLTGALLHDIGKIESYSTASVIEYTDSGRLLGHIVVGDRLVGDSISKIPGFPAEKKLRIRHLILSHQGSPEQSSPVAPMIPEGMALYIADLLDSKLAAIRRIKKKEHRPGVKWSNFVNLLDRHIYFGSDGDDNGQENI